MIDLHESVATILIEKGYVTDKENNQEVKQVKKVKNEKNS